MEDSAPKRERSRFAWSTFFAMTFFIGLVLLPILFAIAPIERAQWKVAAAANALDAGDSTGAIRLLDDALAIYGDIQKEGNYAWLRFKAQPLESTDEAVIKFAIQLSGKQREIFVDMYTLQLQSQQQFERLVGFYKGILPDKKIRSPEQRNGLAYFQALAGVELEAALEEIDIAIATASETFQQPAYLDTKAWILYRLGRYSEALPLMDQAIGMIEKSIGEAALEKLRKLASEQSTSASSQEKVSTDEEKPNAQEAQLRRRIEEFFELKKKPGFEFAVYRFHRAKILAAAGDIERAEDDFKWLKTMGFEDLDERY